MRYHKYRYNYDKWVKHIGCDPFKYQKQGKKYYDLLSSDYYVNQAFGALNKCWLGFTIAKVKNEYDKLEMYAHRIRKLERQLGKEVLTNFSNWGINN